jgi:hypothetical protein
MILSQAEKRQEPEWLFAAGDASADRGLQRRARDGQLARIAPGRRRNGLFWKT